MCGGRIKGTGKGMRKNTYEQSLESRCVDQENKVEKGNHGKENSALKSWNS